MRRLLLAAVLAVVLGVLSLAHPVAADPLVPNRPPGRPAYTVQAPLYDDSRFEPWVYTFEGEGWDSPVHGTAYIWMNQAMVTKAWLLKVAIRTVEYALTEDFALLFVERAGRTMGALGDALWGTAGAPLAAGGLALAGLWALLLAMRGRASRAWGTLGGSVLVVLLVAATLAAGPDGVESAAGLARGTATLVYDSVDAVGGSRPAGWDLASGAGDAAWRVLVYEPWLAGELSEAGVVQYPASDGLPGGGFLQQPLAVRRAICASGPAQQTYCPWWSLDFLPRRILLSLFTLAATVVYAGALMALAGGIIVAQVTLLLLLALAPVWLLASLWWPGGGTRLLQSVASRALAALLGQAVLAATLAFLLLAGEYTGTLLPLGGWALRSGVLVALAVVAFRYRYGWLSALPDAVARAERGLAGASGALVARMSPAPARPASAGEAVAQAPTARALMEPLYAVLEPAAASAQAPAQARDDGARRMASAGEAQAGTAPVVQHFRSDMQGIRNRLYYQTGEAEAAPPQAAAVPGAEGERGEPQPFTSGGVALPYVPPGARREVAAAVQPAAGPRQVAVREPGPDVTRIPVPRPKG